MKKYNVINTGGYSKLLTEKELKELANSYNFDADCGIEDHDAERDFLNEPIQHAIDYVRQLDHVDEYDAEELEKLNLLVDGEYNGYEGKELTRFFNNKKIANILDKEFECLTIFDGSIWIEPQEEGVVKVSQYRNVEKRYFDVFDELNMLLYIASLVNYDER